MNEDGLHGNISIFKASTGLGGLLGHLSWLRRKSLAIGNTSYGLGKANTISSWLLVRAVTGGLSEALARRLTGS